MNWIVLHDAEDGTPYRINAEQILFYQVSADGIGSALRVSGWIPVHVRETPEQIDYLIAVLRPTYAPVGYLGGHIVMFGQLTSQPPSVKYRFDTPWRVSSIHVSGHEEQRFDANHQPIKE